MNRTQLVNKIKAEWPELARYLKDTYPKWDAYKSQGIQKWRIEEYYDKVRMAVGKKTGKERLAAINTVIPMIRVEERVEQLQDDLIDLAAKADRQEKQIVEQSPINTLLQYGRFNDLSKGLDIIDTGISNISTIELTDDELAHLLQYYTLIYKDDYAYLKDNKTGELTLIPFNKWKLAFKRLSKMLKGFIGILVIGKYGYEVYKEWQTPITVKPLHPKDEAIEILDEYRDDIAQSSNVKPIRSFAGSNRTIVKAGAAPNPVRVVQPIQQPVRKPTTEEKIEAEVKKWASRLGLGVSVLKNAKSLYDLYKWYNR